MLLKKLPKNAIVPEILGTYDGWISINDVEMEPDNAEIFNFDKLNQIAESIEKNGLKEIPNCWKNSTVLTSGHTRLQAFIKNGYTHLPIRYETIERPTSRYERLVYLRISNEYRVLGFADNFRGCESSIDAYSNENGGNVPDSMLTSICKDWGIARQDWNIMVEMKTTPKMYDFYIKVRTGEMGPREAYRDATVKKPKMRMSTKLELNIFNKQDISYMITSVYQSMMGVKNSNFGILAAGREFSTLARLDRNWYSSLAHGVICAYFAAKMNEFEDYSDDWYQTNNMDDLHDVYSRNDDTGVEIKTHICAPTETPRWTPNRFKAGYHLLWAASYNMDSVFILFGKLDDNDAIKVQGGRWEILNDKLLEKQASGDIFVWKGKLISEKGKTTFIQHPTSFGE